MNTLADRVEILLKQHTLTKQDFMEITERVLQIYIDQREKEILQEGQISSDDEAVSVQSDSEGDYIDKKGNIYDVKSKLLIGKKDLNTKKKQMFNLV